MTSAAMPISMAEASGRRAEVGLAIAVVLVIALIVVPLPAMLLDLCLAECDRADVDVVFLWSTPKSRFLYRRKGFLPRDDLLDRRSRRP